MKTVRSAGAWLWVGGLIALSGAAWGAPVITSASSATATVGVPFSYQTTSTSPGATYAITGVPSGLTFNPTTGLLSGTPTADCFGLLVLTATDGTGSGQAALYLRVIFANVAAPRITDGLPVRGTVGSSMVTQIHTFNSANSFSANGLPNGLSIDPLTGSVTGTPAVGGQFYPVILASNAYGQSVYIMNLVINPSVADQYPVASFIRTPASGNIPLAVTFNATSSTDDGSIVSYDWSFGDGTVGSGVTTSHTYSTIGTYFALLTLTDNTGKRDYKMLEVAAQNYRPSQFAVGSAAGDPGVTVDVPITFTPSPDYGTRSFGFDLVLPTGLNFISADAGPAVTSIGHALAAQQNGSLVRFLSYGFDQNVMGPGVAVIMHLQAAPGTPAGTLPLNLINYGDPQQVTVVPGQFTVNPSGAVNTPPVVSAGSDLAVTWPASAQLQGQAADDGKVQPLSYLWSVLSGPAPVTFSLDALRLNPVAVFSQAGTYGLQLEAFDGQYTTTSSMTVFVSPPVLVVNPVLIMGGGNAAIGTDLELAIDLQTGSTGITGTQFSLILPAGVTFVSARIGPGADAAGKMVYSNPTANGAILMVIGFNTTPIPSGTIVNYTIHIGASAAPGSYFIVMTDIVSTDAAGNGVQTDHYDGGLIIQDPANQAPVVNPPAITSALTAMGTVGTAFNYQITATNSPTSFNATGLPAGLSVNTATGLISGTPSAAGAFIVSLSATNTGGTGTRTLTLTLTISGGIPMPTLPKPTLRLPSVMSVTGAIQVEYPDGYNIKEFVWSLELQSPPSGAGATRVMAASQRSASFSTGGKAAALAPWDLIPGLYLVRVNAVDQSNNLSPTEQGAVTLAGDDLNATRVYPSPWRIDSHRNLPITFDNLPSDCEIKIFTISGQWVQTLSHVNGSIGWYRTNASGDTVSSGLYFYVVTDSAGHQTRGKFVIIR